MTNQTISADAKIRHQCEWCGRHATLLPSSTTFGRWSGSCKCGAEYLGISNPAKMVRRSDIKVTCTRFGKELEPK